MKKLHKIYGGNKAGFGILLYKKYNLGHIFKTREHAKLVVSELEKTVVSSLIERNDIKLLLDANTKLLRYIDFVADELHKDNIITYEEWSKYDS